MKLGALLTIKKNEKGARPEDQGYGLIQLTPGPQMTIISLYELAQVWDYFNMMIQPDTPAPGAPI